MRVHARTCAYPRVPSCTCLYSSVASSSHQADVRLVPGCVTYPILVQHGYMAVQHSYMAVQQGYMLDKLSTNEKPRSIVLESSGPMRSLWWVGWGGLGVIFVSNLN